jgi:diketogulonate reductase-like aldo/keto reductase
MIRPHWNRRQVLGAAAALGLLPATALRGEQSMMTKKIPSSSEALPVVGLGTYSVFDVDGTVEEIALRRQIVKLLISNGGSVIDSSPMYNRSEKVIGDVIEAGIDRRNLFLATKVWTDGRSAGLAQMQRSSELMNAEVIDLMQVHNLRDIDVHMTSIRELQQQGRIRYSGITHYTASSLKELEATMQRHKPQFVQINYSLGEREAEQRVLPLARDLGIAVIINRPFQAGKLFRVVANSALPAWAGEFADSWGQFFLKFIVSHPAVTCVIPATSKPQHMADNLGAGFGAMPDAAARNKMINFFASL